MFDKIVIVSGAEGDKIRIIKWIVAVEGGENAAFFEQEKLNAYKELLDRRDKEYIVTAVDVPEEVQKFDGMAFDGGRVAAIDMINGQPYKKTEVQELREQITALELALVEIFEGVLANG